MIRRKWEESFLAEQVSRVPSFYSNVPKAFSWNEKVNSIPPLQGVSKKSLMDFVLIYSYICTYYKKCIFTNFPVLGTTVWICGAQRLILESNLDKPIGMLLMTTMENFLFLPINWNWIKRELKSRKSLPRNQMSNETTIWCVQTCEEPPLIIHSLHPHWKVKLNQCLF